MTLEDLYILLTDPSYSHYFVVFKRDKYFERFRLERPKDLDSFLDRMSNSLTSMYDSGVDSDCFDVYEADFIDCYPK